MVVIAIIAIMAGLVLPALRSAMNSGARVKCIANLRQVGMAHIVWVDTHDDLLVYPYDYPLPDGKMPGETLKRSWLQRLQDVLPGGTNATVDPATVLNCPKRKALSGRADWWEEGVSYGINRSYVHANWEFRFSAVPNPPAIILVAEIDEVKNEWARTSDGKWPHNGSAANDYNMAFRHGTKDSNVLFVDAHAESRSRGDLVMSPPNAANLWRWW
jgi:prepilin-type processing-associated H-X9-DG protein